MNDTQQTLFNSLNVRHYYGGLDFPPGGVAVDERDLARFVIPGATVAHHGVVPIGVLGLPAGSVMTDLAEDVESVRCLPFRFPWHRFAYALKCGESVFAIVRNIQANEVRSGCFAVIQLNDAKHWDTTFGKIKKVNLSSLVLQKCDGEEIHYKHEEIHFVGKITYWWDDRTTNETWIELPDAEVKDELASNGS